MHEKDTSPDPELLGRGSPPLINGDLLFDEPWQSRVFGMARLLSENGAFEWDEFRASLIARIDDWERRNPTAEYQYYPLFLAALTDTLETKGIVDSAQLQAIQQIYSERPAGHDH